MDNVTLTVPDTRETREAGSLWVTQAREVRVVDPESANQANNLLADIKAARKRIHERLDPIVGTAHKAHGQLVKLRADLEEPFILAENTIKGALVGYVTEERRKEEHARRAREAEERKKAEEEQLARAQSLEAQGRVDEAEAVIAAPIMVEAKVAPRAELPKGFSTRETWSAEVLSLPQLIRWIAEGHLEYANLVTPNMTALNELARVQKSAMNMPGVRAVVEVVGAKR